ncbi:MAG TPA: tRNA lysidine(34) synthetase TilS [Sedimenticola sp.]|nr:tRNA lysidine(34) synthetase TilS [Sedimenticola sp.]
MAFSLARLLQILQELPSPRRYLVAFSGGCDSTVLLHAMAALRGEHAAGLAAVHVNHGLQEDASAWAGHCEAVCRDLGVPFVRVDLALEVRQGESLEAAARNARYRALEAQMAGGDMLLTAHHQDDQAETLLLQLLRGSGPRGLAAMPLWSAFGPGFHGRPLLGFEHKQLQDHAAAEGLAWIDDASNRDMRHDRNFLRRQVLPLLRQRWPAMARTISRSAAHCAEAQGLIDEVAAADLKGLTAGGGTWLPLKGLAGLAPPRRGFVLRAWIRERGFPLPDSARLGRIQKEMLNAPRDRAPMVCWAGVEVRRYRDRLYLMSPLPRHDPAMVLDWDGRTALRLPSCPGVLRAEKGTGGIDPAKWSAGKIQVRFRRGGERCRPAGRGHGHSLKKLFQERGLPPWERDRLPLIYIDDQLAAVADLWVCEPFLAGKDAPGIELRFCRSGAPAAKNRP